MLIFSLICFNALRFIVWTFVFIEFEVITAWGYMYREFAEECYVYNDDENCGICWGIIIVDFSYFILSE